MPHTKVMNRGEQPFDPFRDVERAQTFAREGVEAFGEQLRPALLGEIGSTLGGLNRAGALRSGATNVALRDISQRFGEQIGTFASTASLGALGQGLGAGQLRLAGRQQRFAEDEARSARRSALLRSIGSVLGAGIGFAVGGPPGAAAGSQAVR